MENKENIKNRKTNTLKEILEAATVIKNVDKEKKSNTKELVLKSVELYEPISFEEMIKINKKNYRNLKIKMLKENLKETLRNLKYSIDLYKELINRTEFWERKSTYEFNFKDWNTLKKTNGKITRYFNEIKNIYIKIEMGEI